MDAARLALVQVKSEAGAALAQDQKPNILVVWGDDVAGQVICLSCHGTTEADVDDYQAFLTLQPEAPEAPALKVLLGSLS